MTLRTHFFASLLLAMALPLLGGCLEMGDSSVDEATAGNGGDPSDGSGGDSGGGSGNRAPSISGSPPDEARVGQSYNFTPTANDPDGDSLTFSITNRPSWAQFNVATGRLSGTPSAGTEGSYNDIRISVSDGSMTASTPQFAVQVTQTSMGSATLSWNPPSENTDGTALTDLSGYKIYYGTDQGSYPNQVRIDNPGITTYVVDNLPPNTYYFVSTAINGAGMESGFSNVATKVVN